MHTLQIVALLPPLFFTATLRHLRLRIFSRHQQSWRANMPSMRMLTVATLAAGLAIAPAARADDWHGHDDHHHGDHHDGNDVGAAIAGGLIGAGVGAAIAG